jgi:hypothetical protein
VTGVTCRHCLAVLHRVAIPELDEWGWAGEDGQRSGTDPDVAHLQPDPHAYLAALGGRCIAGKGKDRRTDLRAAGEYSMLKVRLEMGGTFHEHYPREQLAYDGPPAPEHCGWPGWLRPSGWQCRQCGAALALERAV